MDADSEGDVCDVDDGVINLSVRSDGLMSWDEEVGFDSWNCYVGDLAVLKATGFYTQTVGGGSLASQECELAVNWTDGGLLLEPGQIVFYLTTGNADGLESGLGSNSAGQLRPNNVPCP